MQKAETWVAILQAGLKLEWKEKGREGGVDAMSSAGVGDILGTDGVLRCA